MCRYSRGSGSIRITLSNNFPNSVARLGTSKTPCYWLIASMTPHAGFPSLPLETCLVILAKLDVKSLINMAATCRGMRVVAKVCALSTIIEKCVYCLNRRAFELLVGN